ncbi:MAG: Transcriptional regulator, Crp/Fnr family [Thermocaproicibacter melissae]
MPLSQSAQDFLRETLPFWGKLTPSQQKAVLDGAVERTFLPGEMLHRGEMDCAGLYVLRSGQVRAYSVSETGREITLFRLLERDVCIFSASCMMKDIRFSISMEVTERTDTILIPTPVFRQLNQESAEVANYTNSILSSRFSDVMWLLEQILFISLDKRLAEYLLKHFAEEGGTLKTTHEEIARDLGTAREVVSRMLKYFQTEGTVKLSRGEITLVDRKKLEAIASSK